MKPFLKKYLLLSTFLLGIGLAKVEGQIAAHTIKQRAVIAVDSGAPLLYHASFKVLKYKFTGLIVFKYLSQEEGTRIVFLSEAGLSIAEFSFVNNRVTCLRTLPMVDRRAAKKYLSKIIYLVLKASHCEQMKEKTDGLQTSYFCKGKTGKHAYICSNDKIEKIIFEKGLFRSATAHLLENKQAGKVEIKKRKKILVEMKIVQNAIK